MSKLVCYRISVHPITDHGSFFFVFFYHTTLFSIRHTKVAPNKDGLDEVSKRRRLLYCKCVNHIVSLDQGDAAGAEGLGERHGEDGHRTPHPGPGPRGGEEGQQQNRGEGAQPELSEHG